MESYGVLIVPLVIGAVLGMIGYSLGWFLMTKHPPTMSQREEERFRRLLAWQTAHLINISGKCLKRTVTAEELLGEQREADEGEQDNAE